MKKQTKTLRARDPERGAALITVVLMATLLLMAGAALIAVTSTTAVNAADATAESQAYYAAEAGEQAVLGVLRGNAPPNPLFNATASNAANKISFRKAVTLSQSNVSGDAATSPRLSRWLNYNGTSLSAVVPVSPSYTAASGMAFAVDEVKDPDSTDIVAFSTSGSYGTPTLPSGLTVTYTPRSATTVYTSTSGATNIGSFAMTASNGNYTVTNVPFTLNLAQTSPWSMTKAISCLMNGSISKTGSNFSGSLTITLPATSYSLNGVVYTISSATLTLNGTTTSATVSATVTAPEPERLRVKVTGYGPRKAVKKMQMLVSRSGFDYNATGAITLRSHDDNSTVLHANIGSSSVFNYNGNDNVNGPSLPAFTVTGAQDAAFINGINSTNNNSTSQVLGYPTPARQVAVSSLDQFLQTTGGANGARAALTMLRTAAKNQKTPGCTGTTDACDRYFASGETPSSIGVGTTDGLMTFVDGDYEMPPDGGAGLLVVTGTLTMRGNADFKGLILVLGGGHVERDGGGGDTSLGAMAIARFDSTSGNFLEPTYNVQGGGSSTMRYDSEWVRKALKSAGPGVLGISEY
jgi:hypothetical protein